MYYKNVVSRFLIRKNLFKRIRHRLSIEFRKINKNAFDDIKYLYNQTQSEPEVIIDGGANIGFVTWEFLKRFPSSKIISYEPNPEIFDVLKKSYKKNKNVICHNIGIGGKKEKLIFHLNNNSGTSSFLHANEYHRSHLAKNIKYNLEIEVIGIQDIMEQYGFNKIDILKLDVEGFELEVLNGCKKLLKERKIDLIYFEVNLTETYVGQPLIEDLITFLRKFQYILFNYYGSHELKTRQNLLTNLLFVSPDFSGQLIN